MRVLDRLNNTQIRFVKISMFKVRFVMITTIATAAILLLFSTGILQNVAFAHQRQLFTIGDKDYLFVVGSIGEPLYVDQKSGVELFAY
jgi:ABC-type sugar transport system substrate-binding protein